MPGVGDDVELGGRPGAVQLPGVSEGTDHVIAPVEEIREALQEPVTAIIEAVKALDFGGFEMLASQTLQAFAASSRTSSESLVSRR